VTFVIVVSVVICDASARSFVKNVKATLAIQVVKGVFSLVSGLVR
jgi:hypothetical protein